MKEITQNPERYSKVAGGFQISASKDIKPLYLPIGVPIENLKPVIQASGIVVKVGENYLCSLETLNEIKDSNNPHYDIIENGSIDVKGKKVGMGKTVKIIELGIDSLNTSIQEREFMNRQSGVISVKYINNEEETIEEIPTLLIKQIDYTLTQSGQRPSDEYSVVDYFMMVNPKTNPDASHYTIIPLRTDTDQQETIFDPKKLQTFLIGLDEQLKLLRRDFNTIKQTFFNGIIPSPNFSGEVIENKVARIDVDDSEIEHSYRFRESNLVSIEATPLKQLQDSLSDTQTELQTELNQRTQNLQQQLLQAESGDITTQRYLQEQLETTKNELADIQKKLGG